MDTQVAVKEASLMEVKDFFGYENIAELRVDWMKLTDADRAEIRQAVEQELRPQVQ